MTYTFPRRSPRPAPFAPGMFKQMTQRLPSHNACASYRATLVALATAYDDIYESHKRISADRTATPAAALVKSAKLAKQKLDSAFSLLRATQADSHAARMALHAQIDAPFIAQAGTPFETVLLRQELRRHFYELPQKQRLEAVKQAMDDKDEASLLAIGAAPARLSGLPREVWDAARSVVIAQHSPEAPAALNALCETEIAATTMEQALLQGVADLIDFQTATDFEKGVVA